MTKQEFMKAAEGRIENDSQNVWVTIGDIQANIKIQAVLGGRQETEPFEASNILEGDVGHPAWDALYEDYLAQK